MSACGILLRRLCRDRRGGAVIETAMAMPVLLVLSFAFIDLTQAFAFRMSMQEYSQTAADFIVASGTKTPTDSEIQKVVADSSGFPTSAVKITRSFDCNGKAASSTSSGCPNASDLRVNYIKVTVTGTYTPLLKISDFADYVPTRTISQSATVRLP
jgi:Flp pilus assembly protein TadG